MTAQPIPQLQPLSIGQLLDRAIRLYRRNFLTFIGIIALVQAPLSLLGFGVGLITVNNMAEVLDSGASQTDPFAIFTPGYFTGLAVSVLLAMVTLLLISGVASAAMTRAVADNYLGQPVSILGSYRRIGRAWAPLVGTLLLAGVIYLGICLWWIVPCVGWLTGLGMIAFFGLVIFPLVVPIVVLEQRGSLYAIQRAWNLARRRFWWVLGFVFILALFSQLVVAGPSAVVGFIFQSLLTDAVQSGSAGSLIVLQTVIQSLLSLVTSLLYLPLQLAGMTLLYFDLRVRTEGFDLALLAQNAGAEPMAVADVTAQVPEAERTSLVTVNELGYFAGISVAVFALYFLILAAFAALGVVLAAAYG